MGIAFSDSGLPMYEQDGETWALGCHPSDQVVFGSMPQFEAAAPLIPANKWQERTSRWFNIPILNQGKTSSCTGQAAAGLAMANRVQSRLKPILLNAYSVYAMINGGRDQGASITQVVQAAQKYGIGETGVFPSQLMYPRDVTPAQLTNMAKHKFTEAYAVKTFDEGCTALQLGYDLIFGIAVGKNFGDLDRDGVSPLPDQIVGGHALRSCGMKMAKTINDWVWETPNSWGTGWGSQGYSYIQRGHFNPKYGFGFDVYAVMYGQVNPEDVQDLPAVPS